MGLNLTRDTATGRHLGWQPTENWPRVKTMQIGRDFNPVFEVGWVGRGWGVLIIFFLREVGVGVGGVVTRTIAVCYLINLCFPSFVLVSEEKVIFVSSHTHLA